MTSDTGLTPFLIAGLAATPTQIAAGLANPEPLARKHGLPVATVVFNLEWWRARK